ncbi:14316_t:CDS:1, partial [Funneliformis caledonium]
LRGVSILRTHHPSTFIARGLKRPKISALRCPEHIKPGSEQKETNRPGSGIIENYYSI